MTKLTLLPWWVLLISLPLSGDEVAPGELRTPDERFVDFPFEPHYLQFIGAGVHFLDEGPKSGQPSSLLHGLPTWSYPYQKLYLHLLKQVTELSFQI